MERKKSFSLNVDLLNGPIFKSILIFAIPLFISNLFQQLYNTVDTMIVGHFLGDSSLAAIGACTPIYDLLVGFALGIGNGMSIVVARSFGRGDSNRLKKAVAGTIVIGLFVAIIMTVIAQVCVKPLLLVLNTPDNIIDEAYHYIATITLFIIVMLAYNLCSGVLRAIGNSFMPLVFLVISSCTNIVLDLLFITKLDMGIQGAAIATVISQLLSAVLCLVYILVWNQSIVPSVRDFKFNLSLYKELLSQGLANGFMGSIVSSGSVILQYGINGIGTATIAGHTAARKIYQFSIMPFFTMALAASTFVSQNRGADNGLRIRKAMKYVYIYDIIVALFVTIIMAFAAPSLVKLISGSSEPVVLTNGSMYLRFGAPFYSVLGILSVTRNALQGIGQKMLPIISSVIEFFGKILFVIVFIPAFKYMAVIFCEPIIWCVMTAQLVYSFYTNEYILKFSKKNRKSSRDL